VFNYFVFGITINIKKMNEIFEYIQNIVHEERINKSALKNINFNNLTFSDFSQKIFDQSFDKLSFKIKLAVKMFDMVKDNGLILWYDFKYNNPKNPDVKGVGKNEIKKLFPEAKKIIFYNVTLAPPIGRRIGKFYNVFNFLFPFFRTHIIAEIYKT